MNEMRQKIAMFIDADNAPAKKFEEVLTEVAKYGVVTIRKSFDTRNYGFRNLSTLFKAIDLFELKRGPANTYLVRDSRKK